MPTPAPVILIPAFEPDARLVALVADLRRDRRAPAVLVVDDGSGAAYEHVFAAVGDLGATVVTHPRNRGKGAALKTGLWHIHTTRPARDVVCADSDGQHLVGDILLVADRLAARSPEDPGPIVLGARSFAGVVPARSRIGNEATRWFVRMAAGLDLRDTQTGLRGYPHHLVDWLLAVPGDRFEFEMAALLRAHAEHLPIVEVPIATVYLDGNASTHFRPLADSARVYAPLLRFVGSSALAAVIDLVGLFVLMALTGNLLIAVVGARLVSATVNFAVNRRLVFGSTGPVRGAAMRYAALAMGLGAANLLLMWSLTGSGTGLILAKLITEAALYVTSFAVQNRVVFRRGPAEVRAHGPLDTSRTRDAAPAVAAAGRAPSTG